MTQRFAFAFSSLLFSLAACAAPDVSIGSANAKLVGGSPSDETEDAVVFIAMHIPERDTAAGAFYLNCTGTLLAPNVVLTARHCVSSNGSSGGVCDMDGMQVRPAPSPFTDYEPANVTVSVGTRLPPSLAPSDFPGRAARFVHSGSTTLCNDDVALIVLEEPIEGATIASIRLHDDDGDVALDDELVAIGWGSTPTSYFPSTRRRREISVVDVGPSATLRGGGQLGPREFLATAALCGGDSGGPAIDPRTGAVVGVAHQVVSPTASGTPDDCGENALSGYMRTSGFADLVYEAFEIAGGAPQLEISQATPENDAGLDHDAAPEPSAPTDDSGCSTTGAPSTASALSMLVCALVIAGRRRRAS